MSKQQANLVCLLVAAIWGGGFIATDAALQTFDPFTVLMIRFIGASIVSIIVCLVSRVKISREALFRGSISGVLMYLAFAFQTFGLFFTNTGQNAFLTAVNVVLVPYIVWLLWKKKPSNHQLAASVVCLAGIACLSLSKGYFSFSFGDSLSLSCAFFFACHIISLEYATENSNSIAINAVQMSVPFDSTGLKFRNDTTNNHCTCVYELCLYDHSGNVLGISTSDFGTKIYRCIECECSFMYRILICECIWILIVA